MMFYGNAGISQMYYFYKIGFELNIFYAIFFLTWPEEQQMRTTSVYVSPAQNLSITSYTP